MQWIRLSILFRSSETEVRKDPVDFIDFSADALFYAPVNRGATQNPSYQLVKTSGC